MESRKAEANKNEPLKVIDVLLYCLNFFGLKFGSSGLVDWVDDCWGNFGSHGNR